MTLQPSRRGFITGLIAFAAAPAIVRASSLMPVKAMVPDLEWFETRNRFEAYTSYFRWERPPGEMPIDMLPGCSELRGTIVRTICRAPPITEFDMIDTSDPLWAMPKE